VFNLLFTTCNWNHNGVGTLEGFFYISTKLSQRHDVAASKAHSLPHKK